MDTFISTVCFDVALSEKERAIIRRLVGGGGKTKFTVLKDAQIAVKIRIPKKKETDDSGEKNRFVAREAPQ